MKHNTQRTLLLKVSSLILGLSLSALAMNAIANTEEATAPTAEAPTAETVAPSAEANTPTTAAPSAEVSTPATAAAPTNATTAPVVNAPTEATPTSSTVATPIAATPTTAAAPTETQPAASTEGSTPPPASPIASMSEIASSAPPMSDIKFAGVSSLRGESNINAANTAGDIKIHPADRAPIARNYFQQPPLIPHRVREYKITVRNNKCMSCHSWKNYKKARATKVSQTHFADRDGNAQSTLAARRYFCNQCHVPQVDAKPLVENNFKPVSELNK